MTLTEAKFRRGMTVHDYIDQIKVNKEAFLDIYQAVEPPSQSTAFLGRLEETLRLAVFTADWCGDAMSTTPAILRLVEAADNIELSVFNRDEELELTDSFLPEDRAGTVPVFVVFDTSQQEIARFIETAAELVPAIDAMDDQISGEAAAESTENPRALVRGRRTAFRVARAREWGNVILEAFVRVLEQGLAMPPGDRPAVGGTKWPPESV